MVGTKPIDLPSRRQWRDAWSIAPGVSKIEACSAGAVPDLFLILLWRGGGSVGRGLVLGTRESPASPLLDIAAGRSCDLLSQVGVALHEPRRLAGGHAHHVVEDEYLAVCPGSRPDADRRDAKRLGDLRAELARNAFEHDA